MPAVVFPDLHELRSCEVCAHIDDKLWKFLCKYQYDIVVSQEEQRHFADRGGLCPFHTWQFQSVASPYGICAGHAPLLDRLAGALRRSASAPFPQEIRSELDNLLPDRPNCILCGIRDEAEHDAVDAAAIALERNSAPALAALSAICFPHFVLLVSAVRDEDLVRTIVRRQATVLELYAEDMKRYAIKHDGVRRHLASEEESTAAERALLLIAGRRQVNFAFPRR
jgi:hypothetical protein